MIAKHIPNMICIFRILLVGPVVWLLWHGDFVATLWLFFIAGFSDGLDGYLARRFGWRSRLGGILDPLADKFLMVSMFITLTLVGMIPLWLAALVVGRDLVIVIGGLVYNWLFGAVELQPTGISKINTLLQLMLVLAVVSEAGYGWPREAWAIALGACVMVSTIVSGVDYVWQWGRKAYLSVADAT
ncbi:MAG: CDP-alcohol phosphatidyltransferase family protein [Proteobacteria bacterium]|nr:CDP-alcohol phosphatidyltransferase family protein [Pseudomonadota bacterium]